MKIGQKLLMLRETWKSIRLIAQPANCFAAIHFNYIHTIFCLFRLRQYSEVENEANDKMKNKAAKQNDKNMHFIFQINDPIYIWIHAFYWANVGGKGRNKLEFIYGIDLSANGKCIANVSTMCVLYIYLYMGNEMSISSAIRLLSVRHTLKLGHMIWLKWHGVWENGEEKREWIKPSQAKQASACKTWQLLRLSISFPLFLSLNTSSRFECQFIAIVSSSDHIQLNAVLFSSPHIHTTVYCRRFFSHSPFN